MQISTLFLLDVSSNMPKAKSDSVLVRKLISQPSIVTKSSAFSKQALRKAKVKHTQLFHDTINQKK